MALHRLTGVSGLLLLKGTSLVASNVPFPESRTQALVAAVQRLAEGYRQVKREVSLVWLEFQHVRVALVQKQRPVWSCSFHQKLTRTPCSAPRRSFLMNTRSGSYSSPWRPSNPPQMAWRSSSSPRRAPPRSSSRKQKPPSMSGPQPERESSASWAKSWVAPRQSISSTAVSPPPACRTPTGMTREQLRALGSQILQQVPNVARQRALEVELNALWEELHN